MSAVIPALNEGRNLPEVARRMPTGIDEIVFVDGHSVDSDDWPSAQPGKLAFQRRALPVSARCGDGASDPDPVGVRLRHHAPPRPAPRWSPSQRNCCAATDTQPGIKKSMRATLRPVAGRPLGLALSGTLAAPDRTDYA